MEHSAQIPSVMTDAEASYGNGSGGHLPTSFSGTKHFMIHANVLELMSRRFQTPETGQW